MKAFLNIIFHVSFFQLDINIHLVFGETALAKSFGHLSLLLNMEEKKVCLF